MQNPNPELPFLLHKTLGSLHPSVALQPSAILVLRAQAVSEQGRHHHPLSAPPWLQSINVTVFAVEPARSLLQPREPGARPLRSSSPSARLPTADAFLKFICLPLAHRGPSSLAGASGIT